MTLADGQGLDEAGNAGQSRSRRRWVWPIVVGALLLLMAAGGTGTYFGWSAATARDLPAPDPSVVTVAPGLYDAGAQVLMPDVRGLTQDDALTALADAGIPRSVISTRTVPWSGQRGLIVSQTPAFGQAAPDSVVLSVAAPAEIPDVIGGPEAQAVRSLEDLGARVLTKRVYRPGTQAGSVLAVSPAVGKPVPEAVTLTVSEAAGAVFLSQVPSIEGGCGTGETVLSGTDRLGAVLCRAGSVEFPNEVAYLLRGGVQEIEGTIGIPDDQDPSATATLALVLDGKVVRTVRVKYGAPAEVSVKAPGALRLDVRVWTASEDLSPTVALADVELRGDPATIDLIRQDQP